MEENTNFDLGTLYEDSKNQKTVQGDFSLKKTKKTKQKKKNPNQNNWTPLSSPQFAVFLWFGFFLVQQESSAKSLAVTLANK